MAPLAVKSLNRKLDGYKNGAHHWQIVILWLDPAGHVFIDQWPAVWKY
jgi:hypothetical protein